MLKLIKPLVVILAVVAALTPNLLALPQEIKAQPELVASDTPRTTPGGVTFTVPAGWSIAQGKNMVALAPPETDTHIAILDMQAADAKAAVEAGWAAYKPEAKHPLKLVSPVPARNGPQRLATSARTLSMRIRNWALLMTRP